MQFIVLTEGSAAAAADSAATAAASASASAEDIHVALNPVLVTDPSVYILTVMVGPVLVKGPGMELPQKFSLLYDP